MSSSQHLKYEVSRTAQHIGINNVTFVNVSGYDWACASLLVKYKLLIFIAQSCCFFIQWILINTVVEITTERKRRWLNVHADKLKNKVGLHRIQINNNNNDLARDGLLIEIYKLSNYSMVPLRIRLWNYFSKCMRFCRTNLKINVFICQLKFKVFKIKFFTFSITRTRGSLHSHIINNKNSRDSTTGWNGGNVIRVQLSVNYWVNLQGHSQEHPTLDTLKPCWEKERKKIKSFGWTVIQKATELKVNQFNVSPTVPLPVIKPWLLLDAIVDFTLLEQKIKGNEYNLYNVQKYINEYYSYVQIYTDASKSLDNKIGEAFTVPEFHLSVRKRTSDELSVCRGNDCTIISNTVDRRDKTFEISYLFRFMCIIG